MLILIFSALLYHYIRITIFEGSAQNLAAAAKVINEENFEYFLKPENFPNSIEIAASANDGNLNKPKFIKPALNGENFLTLLYPIGEKIAILKTDVTLYKQLVRQILIDIIAINVTMITLILFYALFLSRILLLPVRKISSKVLKLNEAFLKPIDEKEINTEFLPFVKSVNRLIERIQTFVMYQKELFVGIAHELKTPLAVMKAKNEVTLLKPREGEKYIDALRQNIVEIDNMNKMIGSVLEIGRQEGYQFEEAQKIDIIEYLHKHCTNFQILARQNAKDIKTNLEPETLILTLQPTLFLHIIQNFVQNAIKFSPDESIITINSRLVEDKFCVEIIDCGPGIDEEIDLFAPFKRYGNKGGAGLGLFLAKGAAQAMNAEIAIKNRTDGQTGAIATIEMTI